MEFIKDISYKTYNGNMNDFKQVTFRKKLKMLHNQDW